MAGLGASGAVCTVAKVGGQSTCFVFEAGERRFVLKVLSHEHEHNSLESSRHEYAALEAFAAAVETRAGLAMPRPLALYEEHWAILMTYVDGADIDSFMGRWLCDGHTLDTLAASIVSGLRLYYEARNEAFGDFHPGNVLVQSPARLAFIDPTSPDPFVRRLARSTPMAPLAADLGIWVYAVAVTIFPELRTAGQLPLNRLRLTARLVHAAAQTLLSTDRAAFVGAVYAAARQHVQKMIDTCGPKEKVLGAMTLRVLDLMAARSNRTIGGTTTLERALQASAPLRKARRLQQTVEAFANWPLLVWHRFGLPTRASAVEYRLRSGAVFTMEPGPDDALVLSEVWLGLPYELTDDFRVRAGWKVLDLGAHKGTFAVKAALAGATVWAVEPEPRNAAMLRANVARNAPDRVTVIEAAVASICGEGTLTLQHSPGHTLVPDAPGGPSVAVKLVNLDSLFPLLGPPIDLVKMDIEGSEYDVMNALAPGALDGVRRLIVKCHARGGRSAVAGSLPVIETLRAHGFECTWSAASEMVFGRRAAFVS